MPTKHAHVIQHTHVIDAKKNIYYTTYEWVGKRHWHVRISLRDKDSLPFPLIMIEPMDPLSLYGTFIRTDTLTWWWTWAVAKLTALWMPIKYRIIMTLEVWGLAHIDFGDIPDWKHVGRKR